MKKSATKEKVKTEKITSIAKFDVKKMNKRNILFFVLLSFLLYGKSISNNYSMDDEFVVKNNVQVQKGIKAIPEIFSSTYVIDNQKASYEYRPIVKIAFALEFQFFGANAHTSHFFNILLYAISMALLYSLLIKLLSGYNRIFPFLITLLFLIHPLHSEVVLSLKNRDVILSFLGCILALKYYLKYVEENKIYQLLLGSVFVLFSLLSKKDSMTFFVIIPFTIWFFKNCSFKKIAGIFVSYVLPIFVFSMLAVHAAHSSKKIIVGGISLTNENGIARKFLQWENPLFIHTSVLERIPTGLYSIYFYLKMFLIPHPLISYYGYNQVPIADWRNPIVWIVTILLAFVVYYVIKNIKTKSIIVFGSVFFLVAISMFTNIVVPVVGIVAERFEYIPSLGLCFIAAWVLLKLFKISYENDEKKFPSLSNSFIITIVLITIVYGGRSFARIPAWKDSYTLYATDVNNATESAHTNSLIAAASVQKVKENPNMSIDEKRFHIANAVKYYGESIRIIPTYASSLNNLGMLYYTYYNKPEVSIPYLKKAISLDTNYVEAYFNLATCEAKTNNKVEAERLYLKLISIDPKFMEVYSSLSAMYAEDKKYNKILELNQNAIKKGIVGDVLQINIGNVYFMQGDTVNALPFLEKGVELNPNNRFLNSFLANYFKDKGDLEKANHYYDLMGSSSH
jgi:Tfp pilus assembly protein PilF